MTKDRPQGALNIYSSKEHAFSTRDQELAALFSAQASEILTTAGPDETDEQARATLHDRPGCSANRPSSPEGWTNDKWRSTTRRGFNDTKDFVADVRAAGFTPHVAQNTSNRRSAIDGRTTRHSGYGVSQRIRKRVEEPFGWVKTVGGGRKLHDIGQDRNRAWFKMTTAVYNLIRITTLDTATTG